MFLPAPRRNQVVVGPRTGDPALIVGFFRDWYRGLNASTRENYERDLARFASFIGAGTIEDAVVVLCRGDLLAARDMAHRWKTSLREANEAPRTINRRLSALRSVYAHVSGIPLIVASMREIGRRRRAKGDAGVGAALLIAALDQKPPKRDRDVALILLLHDSGLRRSEAATLRVRDVDVAKRIVWVKGKGLVGEREEVDISIEAATALQRYLGLREAMIEDPVFINCDRARKGLALTPHGVYAIVRDLAEEAGLGDITPHDLRRCGARALAKAGADAETMRRWGRWADYRTPAAYVGDVAEKGRQAVDLLAALRNEATPAGEESENGTGNLPEMPDEL